MPDSGSQGFKDLMKSIFDVFGTFSLEKITKCFSSEMHIFISAWGSLGGYIHSASHCLFLCQE